jgi:N-carbamoyl-L-amino-acid hydrolase
VPHELSIDIGRLTSRLNELAEIGSTGDGGCARLALSDEDRAGRDLVITWMSDLGMEVAVDEIGNVIATRAGLEDGPPVMCGSHIDTVATGGIYDGNLGVLGGLEVIETLASAGVVTRRPLAVAFFTDEEGSRFSPDMLGSLVYCGALSVEEARDIIATDGARLGDELARIGYVGPLPCPGVAPYAYIELLIEQGPVLERNGQVIGAVSGVQGISWQELQIQGQSNHAGTTPMSYRHDAGFVAAEIAVRARKLALEMGADQVATVGRLKLSPDLVNVVAASALLTVDLRNTDETLLVAAEAELKRQVDQICSEEGVSWSARQLARFKPVEFDPRIVDLVERTAGQLGLSVRRLASGAGHDAQMIARMCPAGMIFVPSVDGISHNPKEFTSSEHLQAGANVLLKVMTELADSDVVDSCGPTQALRP